jgi:hypothetical protein
MMLIRLSESYLKTQESVPGAVYEIWVYVEGRIDPEKTEATLKSELYKRFKAEVFDFRVERGAIKFKLRGSPFTWAALLAALPVILALLGLAITLIAVFLCLTTVSKLALGLLGVGLVCLLMVGAMRK